jgi:hypothetical protein
VELLVSTALPEDDTSMLETSTALEDDDKMSTVFLPEAEEALLALGNLCFFILCRS